MRCQGIIPERTYPTHSEVLKGADGNARLDADGKPIKVIHYQTDPARPCEAEATALSRSLREVVAPDGSTRWERVADRLYCAGCFVPGRIEHADGSVTQHPAMAMEEA